MLVYNQSAICLPKPKGFEDLAFLKMYRIIFAYFYLVTLSAKTSKVKSTASFFAHAFGTALTDQPLRNTHPSATSQ